jgi:tellurite resistance protein TehA-like permease
MRMSLADEHAQRPKDERPGFVARLARDADDRIAELHPAYFAMSMSTGVIAMAAHLLELTPVARVLRAINLVAYPILVAVTLLRLARHRARFVADLRDHKRGVGVFTTVAATSVLGSQFAVIDHNLAVARWFLWPAIALWLLCMYGVFTLLTVREGKPSLAEGINGGWLTAVVATQSICVLGCLVAPTFGDRQELMLFGLLSFWLCGGMLYIWMISLIFYRYMFFRFSPSDLMPPYWINMGAMAISGLAGAMLIRAAPASPLLRELLPFLKGFTLWYWATATWWIPMLAILAVWRHGTKQFPLTYDPLYWGAVFPLGMYTVSTFRIAAAAGFPALVAVPRVFIYLALAAWTATFVGLLRRLALLARATPAAETPQPLG